MVLGIDVSKWQGNIDWNKVKKQIAFAIVRAGFGNLASQKDSFFEANYKNAKSAGVPIGCYWYSYAKDPDDARKEADAFLEVVKGKKFEYPIYYDIEESDVLKLGEEKVSAIAKAFLEKVEKAGYWVGLYMSASYLNSVISADIKRGMQFGLHITQTHQSPLTTVRSECGSIRQKEKLTESPEMLT